MKLEEKQKQKKDYIEIDEDLFDEIEAFERLVALGPMVLVGNPMISQGSLPIDHGNNRF